MGKKNRPGWRDFDWRGRWGGGVHRAVHVEVGVRRGEFRNHNGPLRQPSCPSHASNRAAQPLDWPLGHESCNVPPSNSQHRLAFRTSTHAQGLRLRRVRTRLAVAVGDSSFPLSEQGRHTGELISELHASPRSTSRYTSEQRRRSPPSLYPEN